MSRIWIGAWLWLCSAAALTAAQTDLDLFGYYEPQAAVTRVGGAGYQLFSNKLRLDLSSAPSDRVSFAANINALTYHGKKEWDLLEFLSPPIVAGVPETMRPLYRLPFEDRIVLDNAYVRLSFPVFDLTVGKQQISLGTGYVWNPTDVFNIKDVLDPTYEQPGHNAVRMDIPLGGRTTASLLYSPVDTWKESGKLLRIKAGWGRFDTTAVLIETRWDLHDYTSLEGDEPGFKAVPEIRRLVGGSAVGELLGLGIWAEFAYSWMERTPDFYELVTGADITFTNQTYVMAEFYRNTSAPSDPEGYSLNDWMRYFASERKTVCRDQVYGMVRHPLTDLLDVALQGIVCLSDGSWAFVPTAYYSLSDDAEIFAYLNLNFGSEGKAYSRNLGNGGLIRLRIYF